jgi:transcriptional regulator with XRE-family HTH domain
MGTFCHFVNDKKSLSNLSKKSDTYGMLKPKGKKMTRRPHWAERLALIRKCTGLTQEKFGETIGVTKGAFRLYEYGKREPTFATLRRIRRTYKIPLDVLICEPGDLKLNVDEREFDLAMAPRAEQLRYLEAVLKATEEPPAGGQPKTQPLQPSSAQTHGRSKPQ